MVKGGTINMDENDKLKKVKSIFWDNEESLSANEKQELIFQEFFMGDHSEAWIVVKDKNSGIEKARHNTRFISTIIWE